MTAVNKVDRLGRAGTVKALAAAGELELPGEVFPVSARTGRGCRSSWSTSWRCCRRARSSTRPTSTPTSPRRCGSPSSCASRCCGGRAQELPHAVEVEVDRDRASARTGCCMVSAQVWAESESQKGILVGSGGRMIKAIGTAARREIERRRRRADAPRAAGARATRLAPRRGAARPARHRVTDRDRIRAFLRESEEAVCDEARPARHGTALLSPTLPRVWQLNALRVEDARRGPATARGGGGEATGGLGHRSCSCPTGSSARGSRPSWRAGAGTSARLLVMVKRREPDRPAPHGVGR